MTIRVYTNYNVQGIIIEQSLHGEQSQITLTAEAAKVLRPLLTTALNYARHKSSMTASVVSFFNIVVTDNGTIGIDDLRNNGHIIMTANALAALLELFPRYIAIASNSHVPMGVN